jgi:hypothetical protein
LTYETPADAEVGDEWYTIRPGETMYFDGFDIPVGMNNTIVNALLWVSYYVNDTAWDGYLANSINISLDTADGPGSPTTIDTGMYVEGWEQGYQEEYNLTLNFPQLDTLNELRTLDLWYQNLDLADYVHFDTVRILVTYELPSETNYNDLQNDGTTALPTAIAPDDGWYTVLNRTRMYIDGFNVPWGQNVQIINANLTVQYDVNDTNADGLFTSSPIYVSLDDPDSPGSMDPQATTIMPVYG